MGKLRSQYHQEFKEQLLEEVILGGATVSQISRNHQLHPVLIQLDKTIETRRHSEYQDTKREVT